MKLDSNYFDSIRAGTAKARGRASAKGAGGKGRPSQSAGTRACEAPGCEAVGEYRAPKGRSSEGEYLWFCLDHVRAYNKSYNYFADMPDADVLAWQRASLTGHRPTWKMGTSRADGMRSGDARFNPGAETIDDPFGVFPDSRRAKPAPPPPRRMRSRERRALEELGLDEDARAPDIKARYKELVKRHHPDANGGDRSSEERLREIISAYRTLKDANFC